MLRTARWRTVLVSTLLTLVGSSSPASWA
jgi:hypothetical protein